MTPRRRGGGAKMTPRGAKMASGGAKMNAKMRVKGR